MRDKLILLLMAASIMAFLVILSGCDLFNQLTNQKPTAEAGADQTVQLGETVSLDGRNSSDPEGDSLTYTWSISLVPQASGITNNKISAAAQAIASFTPDVEGDYTADLKVSDGNQSASDSVRIKVTTTGGGGGGVPSAPTIAATPGDTQVTISWAGVNGATSYNLYWKAGSTVTKATGTQVSGVTSPHLVTGLANGSQYAFVLTAVNSSGESGTSNLATATPLAGIPSAPTGLNVSGATATSLMVSWNAVTGALSYAVYRDANPTGAFTSVMYVGATPSFTDMGLSPGATYYYEVTVTTSGGTSAKSSAASGTTAPGAPSISATPGDAQVTITWAPVTGATNYNLYWTQGSTVTTGTGTKVSSVGSPWTVMGLTDGIQYAFLVTSVNASGEGAASNVATATPVAGLPSAPTGLAVSGASATSLMVSWTANGATSYTAYRDTSATGSFTNQVYSGAAASFTDSPLSSGTTYYYEVTATNGVGTSTKSGWQSGTTLPAAPTIQAAAGDGNVTVSWLPVTGATTYTLYYLQGSTVTTGSGVQVSGVTSPHAVAGLTNGSQYAFIVTASNASGASAASSTVTATPQAGIPSTPTGLWVGSATGTSLTVSWNAVTGATSYQVFRDTSSGGLFTNQVYSGGPTSYTDSSLSRGTIYYYEVRATNASGSSPKSSWQSGVTIPSAPTIQAVAGDAQATITWVSVNGASSYNLYYTIGSTVTTGTGTQIAGVASPYVLTGLTNTPATQYAFIVTAVNSGGESVGSNVATATPVPGLPATPTGLWVSGATASSLAVSWNSVSGSDLYVVYRDTSPTGSFSFQAYSGASTSFTSGSLTSGTTYYYVVKAHNVSGFSALSASVSGTTIPGAPAITATPYDSQVTVSWAAVNGATSYNLYYTIGSTVTTGTGSEIAYVTSPFGLTGLANSTQYAFIVTAVNASGEGAASAVATATPMPGVPPAPAGLTIFNATGTTLTVAWNAVSGADEYTVYRDIASNGPFSTWVYTGAATSFTDTGLSSATTYYYVVMAHNVSGYGSLSAPQYGTTATVPPATPMGLNVTGQTISSLTISWNMSTGATSYQLYRDTNPYGLFTTQVYSGSATTYTDTGLASGSNYFYEVQASNEAGSSGKSGYRSGTTTAVPPSTPTGVTVGNATVGSLTVTWTAVPGANWYEIRRDGGSVGGNNGTSFTDTSLAAGTTHTYEVRAGNNAGQSLFSAPVSGTTLTLPAGEGGYGYGIQ